MKQSDFRALQEQHPGWADKNVKPIALEFIAGTDTNTQIRQDDVDTQHIQLLMNSLWNYQQRVPVTVELIGADEAGNPNYRLVDGNHRYTAISKLKKRHPNDSRWVTIKVVEKKFNSDWERITYQSNANAHDATCKVTSIDDVVTTMVRIITQGMPGAPAAVSSLHNSSGRNITDPVRYSKELKKAVEEIADYLTPKQREAVVRKLQGNALPGKFKRWGAGEVKDAFMDWADTESGQGVSYKNDDFIVAVKNENFLEYELIGRCFKAKTTSTNKPFAGSSENIVIMHYANVSGKDNAAIDDARRRMVEKINKYNSSWLLKVFKVFGKVKLVDRIYIAPQKRDPWTKETGFQEVKINKKGKFSTTTIPRNGWDNMDPQAPPMSDEQFSELIESLS